MASTHKMKTEIQETELYKKFKDVLGIKDMREDDNPFIVECCKIAEDYKLSNCECMACGFIGKESELTNNTHKHDKDDVLICPKCNANEIKFL